MDIFERKDTKLPFKEIAQLKKIGTPEAYMLEFENLSVMVSDVLMARLVLLFTKGLKEPLKGLMKTHEPATLKDAMNLTRDLQNVLPKIKYPPKPNFPSKFKEGRNPWKNEYFFKENKGGPSKEELKRNKLCFTCQ